MKIDCTCVLMDLTEDDFINLGDSLDRIDEACEVVRNRLQDQLLIRATKREQYLQRLIRFCHSGK